MQRSIWAILGATLLIVGAAKYGQSHAQAPAAPGTPQATGKNGVNVGQLSCQVAGGVGFIFGSSKELDCLFTRTDSVAEHYHGSIQKYGVDIGFTKEAHVIWIVFAPGAIDKGALAGGYGGVSASVSAGIGLGANVLIGGSNKQITLQPVSVEGSIGLNVAAGIGEVILSAGK
jgi:Protein of unknown function (DUF992)